VSEHADLTRQGPRAQRTRVNAITGRGGRAVSWCSPGRWRSGSSRR